MAKYTVTCLECGKEWTTQLFGKNKDREWKLNNFDWTCDDCKEKARQSNNEKSALENSKAGLPALEGSEKQIAWAETIRKQILNKLKFELKNTLKRLKIKNIEGYQARLRIVLNSIKNNKSASWWIDHRSGFYYGDLIIMVNETELPDEKEEREKAQQAEAELIQAAKQESTVQPAEPKTSTIAEIAVKDNVITISFPEKRDDFRTIVKKYGYTWKDCWQRNVKQNIEDSAAQIGHILLSKGFGIRIFNEKIRNMAVEGSFTSENFNRVALTVTGKYEGWLAISWNRNIEDFYNRARKIKGSRWNSPCVVVPPENYIEVQDFAELYGFYFTEKAEEAINKQIEAKEKILTVDISEVNISKNKTNGKAVLEVPSIVEVADELKD